LDEGSINYIIEQTLPLDESDFELDVDVSVDGADTSGAEVDSLLVSPASHPASPIVALTSPVLLTITSPTEGD
jgi:hypothetical protein